MYITAEHLREQVIKPTLEYLGAWTESMEQELLDDALGERDRGLFQRNQTGLGLFQISSAQHRDLWDRYLAFRPDLASRVRGLASQRAFLSNPDSELQTNLSYSTAIAWLMRQRHRSDTALSTRSSLSSAPLTARAVHA